MYAQSTPLNPFHHLQVDDYLKVEGHSNWFAIGKPFPFSGLNILNTADVGAEKGCNGCIDVCQHYTER